MPLSSLTIILWQFNYDHAVLLTLYPMLQRLNKNGISRRQSEQFGHVYLAEIHKDIVGHHKKNDRYKEKNWFGKNAYRTLLCMRGMG